MPVPTISVTGLPFSMWVWLRSPALRALRRKLDSCGWVHGLPCRVYAPAAFHSAHTSPRLEPARIAPYACATSGAVRGSGCRVSRKQPLRDRRRLVARGLTHHVDELGVRDVFEYMYCLSA